MGLHWKFDDSPNRPILCAVTNSSSVHFYQIYRLPPDGHAWPCYAVGWGTRNNLIALLGERFASIYDAMDFAQKKDDLRLEGQRNQEADVSSPLSWELVPPSFIGVGPDSSENYSVIDDGDGCFLACHGEGLLSCFGDFDDENYEYFDNIAKAMQACETHYEKLVSREKRHCPIIPTEEKKD